VVQVVKGLGRRSGYWDFISQVQTVHRQTRSTGEKGKSGEGEEEGIGGFERVGSQ